MVWLTFSLDPLFNLTTYVSELLKIYKKEKENSGIKGEVKELEI